MLLGTPYDANMINCQPKSMFSSDFQLSQESQIAQLSFSWFSETGSVHIGQNYFKVVKGGVFSGEWALQNKGEIIYTAEKTSAFRRSIEIQHQGQTYLLKARSAFGRSMEFTGPNVKATIEPVHPFTRRATITGILPPFELSSFAFWLTALLWRRAQRNNNGG